MVNSKQKIPKDIAERGFDSLNKQRATYSRVGRLRQLGLVLVVAISFVNPSVYGQSETPTSLPRLNFPDAATLNGVAALDVYGGIGFARSVSGPDFFDELWTAQRIPVTEDFLAYPFFFGFNIQRDMDFVADPNDNVVGVIVADGYGGVHTYGESPAATPQFRTGVPDFHTQTGVYNASHDPDVFLPYFFPWDLVRDLEVAPDWRAATNAYQGYYILDGFGAVHYVNNPEVLAMIQTEINNATPDERRNDPLVGTKNFFNVFGFRPMYRRHYVPSQEVFDANYDPNPAQNPDKVKVREYMSHAPWVASELPQTPNHRHPYFAKDLEVSTRFFSISTSHVSSSMVRKMAATGLGVPDSALNTPIAIPLDRAQISSTNYGRDVALTNGYYLLSGLGIVHSMLEDGNGSPIPAPWENPKNGMFDPRVNAPYFGFDIAEDLELFPNGLGYALLTSYGEVYLVSAPGADIWNSFDRTSFSNTDPSTMAPYFGFDIARGLKLVAYVDRANYGKPNITSPSVDPRHGKIVGYYVIDGFGTAHGVGNVANLPLDGSALPLYNGDLTTDIEISPVFRPITDSTALFETTLSQTISPLFYPVTDSSASGGFVLGLL